ncbi:MAG: hypothetical protein WD045_07160 [Pirellulaceae bacterium]
MPRTTAVLLLCVAITQSGCMSGWGVPSPPSQSALTSYLDSPAQGGASADRRDSQATTQVARVETSDQQDVVSSLAAKAEARLAAAQKPLGYEARVARLDLPESDKEQILEDFSAASDAQWEELLTKLEPVFLRETRVAQSPSQAPAQQQKAQQGDLAAQFAEKLVTRHLENKPETAQEQPQRLPEPVGTPSAEHLAGVDASQYPRTDQGHAPVSRAVVAARADNEKMPTEFVHAQTDIRLAAHSSAVGKDDGGLYPEQLASHAQAVPGSQLSHGIPRKSTKPSDGETGETSEPRELSPLEWLVMEVIWEHKQVSAEVLLKEMRHRSPVAGGPRYVKSTDDQNPDPAAMQPDELYGVLYDLRDAGWITEGRRGNAINFWALKPKPKNHTPDWNSQLDSTIASLEQEVGNRRLSESQRAQMELRLRMLYLLSGRKSDAVSKVDLLPEDEQEVWSQLIFGMEDYMKTGEMPADRRSLLALGAFRRATDRLREVSPLELRNIEFIQSVDSFGQFKKFPQPEFREGQEVLLYVEIDNFTSEHSGDTFETVLSGGYEIYDPAGRRVDARKFAEVKDTCQQQRRDFYVPYRIYMPDEIAPGNYRMELTITDNKAEKFGQASIEFRIKK